MLFYVLQVLAIDCFTSCLCVVTDCDRLIRRMLQLDPSKRISLASVLKHRWMAGVEVTMDMPTKCHRGSNASGESVLWNDQVLMALQNMNYNVDICKQVCLVCIGRDAT